MEAKYDFARKYRKDILLCSRCGYCQAVCPCFGATLRPSLNARGKMLLLKEVMDGELELSDELIETLFQCTTCGACHENCPSGVDVPKIIKAARKDMVHIGSCHPAFTGMNQVLSEHTNIYAETDPVDLERERGRKAPYVYFVGCVGLYREEDATEAALALLDRLKVDFTLVDEVCCTGVLEDVGFSLNQKHTQHNVDAILATGAHTVITGCPYCFRTLNGKAEYAALRDAGVKVIHISQFLAGQDLDGVTTAKKVTYHDPCDLGRHCGIYEEPRATIRRFAPNFVEMEHHHAKSLCCGSGGGARGAYPKNSVAMAKNRLAEALAVEADVLLTECGSCVHNLSNAKLRSQKIRIVNTVEFLNELLEDAE